MTTISGLQAAGAATCISTVGVLLKTQHIRGRRVTRELCAWHLHSALPAWAGGLVTASAGQRAAQAQLPVAQLQAQLQVGALWFRADWGWKVSPLNSSLDFLSTCCATPLQPPCSVNAPNGGLFLLHFPSWSRRCEDSSTALCRACTALSPTGRRAACSLLVSHTSSY